MPRLRTILALCVLALVFSMAATALLSSVQRLSGSVILDPGASPAVPVRSEHRRTHRAARHVVRPESGSDASAVQAAEPQAVFSPPPKYPIQALRRNRGGLVRIRVMLGADGHVADAQVVDSSGDADLDRAALDAARQWRFRMPQGARREAVVPIRFRIDAQGR